MGRVDLDAVQAEKDGEPHEVMIGGKLLHVRAAFPPSIIRFLVPPDFDPEHPEKLEGFVPDFVSVARILFVDADDPETLSDEISENGWEAIFELYGVSLPESSASAASSSPIPAPSRPISQSTTE